MHTLGEWKAIQGEPTAIVSLPEGNHIADVYLIDMTNSGNKRANARLIAAAPDLLEACETLSDACEKLADLVDAIADGEIPWTDIDSFTSQPTRISVNDVALAIAKARGDESEVLK